MNVQYPDSSATARASEGKDKCRQKLWPKHGEADVRALPQRCWGSVAPSAAGDQPPPAPLGFSTPNTSQPPSQPRGYRGSGEVATTVPARGSHFASTTEPRCRRNGGSTDGPLSLNRREDFLFTCVGSAQITHQGPELQAGRGRNSLQMKGCQKIVFSQLRVCVRKGRREEGAAEAVTVTDFLTS